MERYFQRRKSSIKLEFTEKELLDLQTAFDLLEKDEDGRVTLTALKSMLKKLRIDFNEESLEHLVKVPSDDDGEVRLNQNDFLQWIKALQTLKPEENDEESSRENLLEAFKVFDLNDDGYISRDELKAAMETINEPLSDQQINELISYADVDKDGRINYEEFANILL